MRGRIVTRDVDEGAAGSQDRRRWGRRVRGRSPGDRPSRTVVNPPNVDGGENLALCQESRPFPDVVVDVQECGRMTCLSGADRPPHPAFGTRHRAATAAGASARERTGHPVPAFLSRGGPTWSGMRPCPLESRRALDGPVRARSSRRDEHDALRALHPMRSPLLQRGPLVERRPVRGVRRGPPATPRRFPRRRPARPSGPHRFARAPGGAAART